MKCKECGCYLSPEEKDYILERLVEGDRLELICDDCIDKWYFAIAEKRIKAEANQTKLFQ